MDHTGYVCCYFLNCIGIVIPFPSFIQTIILCSAFFLQTVSSNAA